MNKFAKFFWEEKKRNIVSKWHHYLEIYDTHFKQFQGKNPVILEVGVQKGGSIEMWNYYFDNKCTIYGIDIDPKCKDIEQSFNNVKIITGDQANADFWTDLKSKIPKIDILIDDGGHGMDQQIITYESMFHHISDNGIYLCEDLHTSYWPEYKGGLKKPNTFIEYSKNFIDLINAYHIREVYPRYNDLTFRKATNSIHYYDSVIVIQKRVDHIVPVYSDKQ